MRPSHEKKILTQTQSIHPQKKWPYRFHIHYFSFAKTHTPPMITHASVSRKSLENTALSRSALNLCIIWKNKGKNTHVEWRKKRSIQSGDFSRRRCFHISRENRLLFMFMCARVSRSWSVFCEKIVIFSDTYFVDGLKI